MSSKLSVTVLKAQGIPHDSDIHKMHMHLVNILQEKEGLEVKTRNSLTEATIKASDFIVLCGIDGSTLSEYFKCLALAQTSPEVELPKIFVYDEPGSWVEDNINSLLRALTDRARVDVKVFNKTVYCWTYRDIIGTLNVEVKKLEKLTQQPESVV